MPFYFYHQERLQRQIAQLAELRYRDRKTISSFQVYEDAGENGVTKPPQNAPEGVLHLGDYWKGTDQYLWLCTEVQLDESLADKDIIALFDFGRTDSGGNGFESLLYVDGEAYQAMDGNHKEVFLDSKKAGSVIRLEFRAWSGLDDGQVVEVEHKLRQAEIGWLDRGCDELYYMAKNIMETLPELNEDDPNQTWLMNLLVDAFNRIDFSVPGSDEFYQSVGAANDFLNQQLQGQDQMNVSVSLIGHTHIDVAWLWRLKHTREKCARSFSTVNRLMERYEDYQFLQSQPQLYDYLKQDYPELFAMIQKRVKEGRWEPSGSMWVECDCNLTSGESIVRQIMYGKRFFEKEFGYVNDFLWLPDVFGYSWALPQILKKAGVNTFVTTKISWNDTNKLPYDTFSWRGMDGTEITTHFITSPEHSANRYYTYNGIVDPYMVKGVWSKYANKDVNTDLLIAYGYGDGGGGANRDMLENMRCLKKLPGIPKVKSEHAADYFRRLNQTLQENPRKGYLPVWDGELYLEFHRGTYTSQAYNKKMNRRLEFLARNTEMMAVVAMLRSQQAYPQEQIYEAWKIIMRQQFHDIIPGSSIKEVYDDCREEYTQAFALLNEALNQSMVALTEEKAGCYTVANTLNWKRDTVAFLPGCNKGACFTDEAGAELAARFEENGAWVLVKGLAPMSMKTIFSAKGDTAVKSGMLPETQAVHTAYYDICWNSSGQLTSVYDRENQREILPAGECANVFQVFEDKPRQFDAWELESTFENKMEQVDRLVKVAVEENPLGILVTFDWEYRKSTIRQVLKLYHHSRRIDFDTTVQWHEREKIMKAAFPVNIRATSAQYDIQYGNISRPITRNTSWEAAKYEVVAHKWVDLSEGNYGVALLNDCKYGHDIKGNTMRLTLLKCSNYPDKTADEGEHRFTYSLLPHSGQWNEADLEQQALDLNNPALVLKDRAGYDRSWLNISADNVSVDALKKAEDDSGIIIRFHEFAGNRTELKLQPPVAGCRWCDCDLMEQPITEIAQGEIVLKITPYELKTIKIMA